MEGKIIASGKRKRSIARAVLSEGNGKIIINKQPYEMLNTFKRLMIKEPLEIAEKTLGEKNFNVFNISVEARGGGQESQIEAARLAIARVLVKASNSAELKKAFLAYDRNMLVADTRRKEAYKPNDSKARAKRQKSYR